MKTSFYYVTKQATICSMLYKAHIKKIKKEILEMKKELSIIFILVMVCLFAACGAATVNNNDVALNDIYETALDAAADATGEEITLFPEESAETLESFYNGFSGLNIEESFVAMHPVTGAPWEIAIVKVKGEDDVEAAMNVMFDRIEFGSDDDFYADNAAGWKNNATVLNYGNYVIMICMMDGTNAAADAVAAMFEG